MRRREFITTLGGAATTVAWPLVIGTSESVLAAEPEYGTRAEAVAMVKRAQDMFKKDGADATFKAISDPSNKEFHDRDL